MVRQIDTSMRVLTPFVLVPCVAAIDYLIDARISFSLLYLIPVVLAMRSSGTYPATAIAVVTSVVWAAVSLFSPSFVRNPLVSAWDLLSQLACLLVVAVILDRRRALLRTDPLTHVLNCRAFRELVESEIGRTGRYGHPLSLAFIDVDAHGSAFHGGIPHWRGGSAHVFGQEPREGRGRFFTFGGDRGLVTPSKRGLAQT